MTKRTVCSGAHVAQSLVFCVVFCRSLFILLLILSVRKDFFANYNKTRINISHQHDHWMGLKEALKGQTCDEV